MGFLLRADRSALKSLHTIHPGAAFYAALLLENGHIPEHPPLDQGRDSAEAEETGEAPGAIEGNSSESMPSEPLDGTPISRDESRELSRSLYEAALDSPSQAVREAAALRLIPLMLTSGDTSLARRMAKSGNATRHPALYAAALFALGRTRELLRVYSRRNPESAWERALSLVASLPDEAARSNLERFLFTEPPGDRAYSWAVAYVLSLRNPPFSPGVLAAIAGRSAIARSSYWEGLAFFREALNQDSSLFFAYPDLLAALGRAFQYASSNDEGIALFTEWQAQLSVNPAVGEEQVGELQFLLAFYAGRISRQRGALAAAIRFFSQALETAPDPVQQDACVWYILNLTLLTDPPELVPLLRRFLPLWHSPSYFDDIFERYIQQLCAARDWQHLTELYDSLPPGFGGKARSQCAYILGRLIELGRIQGDANGYFAEISAEPGASWFYRALTASRISWELPHEQTLGASLVRENSRNRASRFPNRDRVDFLLGFFQFSATEYISPWLEGSLETLSIPELRAIARACQDAGRVDESMRIVSRYYRRFQDEITREDLELWYPRPYLALVETHSQESGIPAWLLFALIRTESAFKPAAVSHAGAVGLTQLIPSTALDMAQRLMRQGGPEYLAPDRVALEDPETNIHLGSAYLRYLTSNLDPPILALLAYNGGINRVRRWWRIAEGYFPPDLFLETVEFQETREYGRAVVEAAAVYGYLYYDMSMEGVIADMYQGTSTNFSF